MQNRPGTNAASSTSDELCIRFVNTAVWRLRDAQEERLPTPETLLRWLGENGLGIPGDLAQVASLAKDEPSAMADLYRAAIALREATYRILHAQIEGDVPQSADLAVLNGSLTPMAPAMEVAFDGEKMGWRLTSLNTLPLDLLRPIALSAADLMTGPRADKIRQCCDDRGCGWLFVDESRAQNRRWCSMGDCGNRAKAMRHRARNKRLREP
jgi:predicted RNA-binding Zn ribbon-like protein